MVSLSSPFPPFSFLFSLFPFLFSLLLISSASASQDFEGRGAEDLNNELSQLMDKILTGNSGIDLQALCIIPGSQCWALYIDALVLDFGGNLFDAIMVGVRAALANTK